MRHVEVAHAACDPRVFDQSPNVGGDVDHLHLRPGLDPQGVHGPTPPTIRRNSRNIASRRRSGPAESRAPPLSEEAPLLHSRAMSSQLVAAVQIRTGPDL